MSDTYSDIYNLCFEKNLTFAIFRLPGQSDSTTYIQTSPASIEYSSINDITEKKGFIMAPFDTRNGKRYIMVRPDIVLENGDTGERALDRISTLPDNQQPSWNIEPP